jgi:hypothetical protein
MGGAPRTTLRASSQFKCMLDLLLETKGSAGRKKTQEPNMQSATGQWVAKSPPQRRQRRSPAGLSPGALIHSFHSLEKLYLMQNGPLELQNILPSTPAAVFSSLQGVASMAVVSWTSLSLCSLLQVEKGKWITPGSTSLAKRGAEKERLGVDGGGQWSVAFGRVAFGRVEFREGRWESHRTLPC